MTFLFLVTFRGPNHIDVKASLINFNIMQCGLPHPLREKMRATMMEMAPSPVTLQAVPKLSMVM